MYYANINQKEVRVAILILDKGDFRQEKLLGKKRNIT